MLHDLETTDVMLEKGVFCATPEQVRAALATKGDAREILEGVIDEYNALNRTTISVDFLLQLGQEKNTALPDKTTALQLAHFLSEVQKKVRLCVAENDAITPVSLNEPPGDIMHMLQNAEAEKIPVHLLLRACQTLLADTAKQVGKLLTQDFQFAAPAIDETTIHEDSMRILDAGTAEELVQYLGMLKLTEKQALLRKLLEGFQQEHHLHVSVGRYWQERLQQEMAGKKIEPIFFLTGSKHQDALHAAIDHCKKTRSRFPKVVIREGGENEVRQEFDVHMESFDWLEFSTPAVLQFLKSLETTSDRHFVLQRLLQHVAQIPAKSSGRYLEKSAQVAPTNVVSVWKGQWFEAEWAKIIYHFRKLWVAQKNVLEKAKTTSSQPMEDQ